MMNYHTKQIKAIKLAIESLQRERRRLYAASEAAYRQGIRRDFLNSNSIVGELFSFAEEDHKKYKEYTDAMNELEDLIDILTDKGVTRDRNLFSTFEEIK